MADDVDAFKDDVGDLVTDRLSAVDTHPTQLVRLTAVPKVLSAPKPITVFIPE
jgi:LmbE family N-acetylglucosaminyl deacetylase